MTTIVKLRRKEAHRLAKSARADQPALPVFGGCPLGQDSAHEYQAAWESQKEGVSDGVMFCSKCGDVRPMRPFVPLDDR